MTTPRFYWITAIFYTLFIFFLSLFALPIGERFGGDIFYYRGLLAAGIISGSILLMTLWKKRRKMGALKWAALIFIFSVYVIFYFTLQIRIEEIHLINFAILNILFQKAFASSGMEPSYGYAAGLSVFIGCSDEFLQKFIPGRVGDWHDVGLGVAGALLGAALTRVTS